MPSVKLSVTVRKSLAAKYAETDLAKIDAAVGDWIEADQKRGIQTVHLALDDTKAMKAHGLEPLTGIPTAAKVKANVDVLFRKFAPDYVVLFGGEDVVPMFIVANPSYDANGDGDSDQQVKTDSPYACSNAYKASSLASYLVPDRVVGRLSDLPGDSDPAWLLAQLATATSWKPVPHGDYAGAYTICCAEWKDAGVECVQYFGEPANRLLIAPPAVDGSSTNLSRLASRLHMVKCHGAQVDPHFYGQSGSQYPPSLSSMSLQGRVKAGTVAAAMCCYGAQVFSTKDPGLSPSGAWPISMAYLRQGAFGFAGSTEIAWVGSDHMACADWIVARYLKAVLDGASQGRAFLESKQDYVRWIQQQGTTPGRDDEKTLIEYVLLGDPSIHPVAAAGGPGRSTVAATFVPSLAKGWAVERHNRRSFRAMLASQIRVLLPQKTPAKAGRAGALFQKVTSLLKQHRLALDSIRGRAQVDMVKTKVGGAVAAFMGAQPSASAQYHYYWTGSKVVDGHRRIHLLKAETDINGNLLRARMVYSS